MNSLKPLGSGIIPTTLASIYSLFIFFRNVWYTYFTISVKKTSFTTISVGGIHAGGTGKTPMSQLIGTYLEQQGHTVAFLSRGYGRLSSKQILVKPGEKKNWQDIGDEPAMLHNNLPHSWLGIGANRYQVIKKLSPFLDRGSIMILDDGFQHRRIFRNKNIVCLPANPFNDRLIPAGYMREPLSSLKRADIICLIGSEKETDILEKNYKKIKNHFQKSEVFMLYQSADKWVNLKTEKDTSHPPLKRPLLVSGIARHERFLELVKNSGITPCRSVHYEDHHIFTEQEINNLYTKDFDGIITTEKDIIRLSTNNLVKCINIWYLKINLLFYSKVQQNRFCKTIVG